MKHKLGIGTILAVVGALTIVGVVLAATITIDRNTTDWPGDPTCTIGATGCALVNLAPQEGTIPDQYNLEQTWFTNDTQYLYFRIDTYAPIDFSRLGERIDFCLDTDQDTSTGWVDGTCNSIGSEYLVELANERTGLNLYLISCSTASCATIDWTGTGTGPDPDFALGTHAIEIRVPLSAFSPSLTNGQAINEAAYFDNSDSPPDDHSPDTGSNTIIVGCATPGNCSPTAITLSSLDAKSQTENAASLVLLAVVVLGLGTLGFVTIRRRARSL